MNNALVYYMYNSSNQAKEQADESVTSGKFLLGK